MKPAVWRVLIKFVQLFLVCASRRFHTHVYFFPFLYSRWQSIGNVFQGVIHNPSSNTSGNINLSCLVDNFFFYCFNDDHMVLIQWEKMLTLRVISVVQVFFHQSPCLIKRFCLDCNVICFTTQTSASHCIGDWYRVGNAGCDGMWREETFP